MNKDARATFGGPIGRTKVSLRFFSDNLDPDTVTVLLGHQPTRAWRAGEMKFGRPAKFGSWHLNSDNSGDLDAQIGNVLAVLTPDISAWSDLTRRHHADLFCGLFLTASNQGLGLMPNTMAAIAQRGLKLSLDIYGSPDTDEPLGGSEI